MSRIWLTGASSLALAILLSGSVHAAESDGGVVTGTGRVTIKRPPQVLRGQFLVTGEAKDVAGAVAKLKETHAAAMKKLIELGAADKSIEVGPTQLGGSTADARTQYAQYVQELQRMMGGWRAGGAKPPAKSQIVVVSCTIKAEWPLAAAANADELFIAGYALQEKIKASGIGKRDPSKLTPQELEAVEELVGEKGASAAAGEPTLQFVCKISDADRAAARAEAFQKAKQEAADTAGAAGTELGALRHVSSATSSPTASEDTSQLLSRMMMQQMGGGAATTATVAEPPTDEASAPTPTPVALQITVTASFGVK